MRRIVMFAILGLIVLASGIYSIVINVNNIDAAKEDYKKSEEAVALYIDEGFMGFDAEAFEETLNMARTEKDKIIKDSTIFISTIALIISVALFFLGAGILKDIYSPDRNAQRERRNQQRTENKRKRLESKLEKLN